MRCQDELISKDSNAPGTLAMANCGQPNTGDSMHPRLYPPGRAYPVPLVTTNELRMQAVRSSSSTWRTTAFSTGFLRAKPSER